MWALRVQEHVGLTLTASLQPGQGKIWLQTFPTTPQRAPRVLGRLCHSWFGTWSTVLGADVSAHSRSGAALGEVTCSLLCTRDVPQLEEGERRVRQPCHTFHLYASDKPCTLNISFQRSFSFCSNTRYSGEWPSWIQY